MSTAQLRVSLAGPLVSFQDGGRHGNLRYGVPASGPMDRTSFAAAHAALGRPAGGTAIEISLGGLVLECTEGTVSFALAGGGFSWTSGTAKGVGWTIGTLEPGQKLTVRGGDWGSWAYLAFAGEVGADRWLGSAATHAMSGFGGGALKQGQVIRISGARTHEDRLGDLPIPDFARPDGRARMVIGPQDQHFAPEAIERFRTETYRLTDAFDRMGVRLDGPKLPLGEALSIPSEPILRGAVQVAGDGVPTILLADHQTTGGYPKIATLLTAATDRVVQMRAGDALRFTALSPGEAVEQAREAAAQKAIYLEAIATPRGSLLERLMSANLISGAVTGHDDAP